AQEVRALLERHAPDAVERVLRDARYPQARQQRAGDANGQGDPAALQAAVADLLADQGELPQRAVQDFFLFANVALEQESEHRYEHEQQRKQRYEGVERDQPGEFTSLVV